MDLCIGLPFISVQQMHTVYLVVTNDYEISATR